MKYLFLVGRNVPLSIAEISSYFERESIKGKIESIRLNGVLIDVEEKLNIKKIINQLGGTMAVGEVLFYGDLNKISKNIIEEQLYMGSSNKIIYSIFNFSNGNDLNKITLSIKKNFKENNLKAKYLPLKGLIQMQEGTELFGSPSKIKKIDERYFLFKKDNSYFFGNLTEVFDAKESEKRDIGKPSRRESLAISPRLAKILVNLSQVKEKKLILDPFCGIGVILQEALLQEINVFGVDIEKKATINCEKNLNWLRKNYNPISKSKVFNNDSGKIVFNEKINGISTEPSLGKLLKKIPSKNEALKMITKFENLMIYVLKNLKKYLVPNAKIAFTSPYISVGNKRISCNINKICSSTGLEKYKLKNNGEISFPISEFRRNQIVGREIHVLINQQNS